jgi:hypothetical protein
LLLRASGALSGDQVDVTAVTRAASADSCGVPHAVALIAFADAVVGGDADALAMARAAVLQELGGAALVDAAAVAANFERMVRVADATGTPLDAPLVAVTETLRRDLDLDRFATAATTSPPPLLWRMAGRFLAPLGLGLLRLWARLTRRSSRTRRVPPAAAPR